MVSNTRFSVFSASGCRENAEPALVIWFQGLTKYLKPRKAKPKA